MEIDIRYGQRWRYLKNIYRENELVFLPIGDTYRLVPIVSLSKEETVKLDVRPYNHPSSLYVYRKIDRVICTHVPLNDFWIFGNILSRKIYEYFVWRDIIILRRFAGERKALAKKLVENILEGHTKDDNLVALLSHVSANAEHIINTVHTIKSLILSKPPARPFVKRKKKTEKALTPCPEVLE